MRKKRLLQQARVGGGGVVKKQQPVADTPLAKRMAEEGGPEMLSDLKTLGDSTATLDLNSAPESTVQAAE